MPIEPAIATHLATGIVCLRPRVLKRTLSSQLARLAAGFADRPVRLEELIDVLQRRGYDAVFIAGCAQFVLCLGFFVLLGLGGSEVWQRFLN